MRIRLSQCHASDFLTRALKAKSAASSMFWQPAMVHEGMQQRRAVHVAFSPSASERAIVREVATMFDVDRPLESVQFIKKDATLASGSFGLHHLQDLHAEPVQVEVRMLCFSKLLGTGNPSERPWRFAEDTEPFDWITNEEERVTFTEAEKF